MALGLLSLSLALASPALAQDAAGTLTPGTLALGTVTVRTPRGLESGTIRVEAAAGACRVEIALDAPGRHRAYRLVMQGGKTVITAPAGVAELAPLPVDPQVGCTLLPRPPGQAASWSGASLAWGSDPDGVATFTESMGGSERLRIRYTAVSSQSFPASEFALPGGAK